MRLFSVLSNLMMGGLCWGFALFGEDIMDGGKTLGGEADPGVYLHGILLEHADADPKWHKK